MQLSGGSEDISNPGLNIIGGIQPRGLRESIPPISGISEAVGWLVDMVGDERLMSCISLCSNEFTGSMLDMVADVEASGSIPSPGPDFRMLSGRHCTLP